MTTKEQLRIVLDDHEAERFLDALEHPVAFAPGLRRLIQRSRTLGTTDSIRRDDRLA